MLGGEGWGRGTHSTHGWTHACLTIAIAVDVPTVWNIEDICKAHGKKIMESSDFSDGKMWGFQLARRVAKGYTWHPANDALRGTASYGTPPTDPSSGPTGTMHWDYKKVQYFMFSTGDFREWYVDAFHLYLYF